MISKLIIDSVIHSYNGRRVLTDVYLMCQKGETVGVLGNNGAGKSTLLRIIFGSIKADNKVLKIDSNYIEVGYKKNGLIGYLNQVSFIPKNLTVKKAVNLFVEDRSIVEAIEQDERIKKLYRNIVGSLSGGELRYLEIVLLLHSQKKFIILDEPFSGIEPLYKDLIVELIKSKQDNFGFIITDQEYRTIIEISDKLMLLKDGYIREIDQLNELVKLGYIPKLKS